jgi:hypothetical protein
VSHDSSVLVSSRADLADRARSARARYREAGARLGRCGRCRRHELFVAASYLHRFDQGQILVAPTYKLSHGALLADAAHALGPMADPGSSASDVTRLAQHAGGIVAYSLPVGAHLFKAGAQVDFLAGTTTFTQYARICSRPTTSRTTPGRRSITRRRCRAMPESLFARTGSIPPLTVQYGSGLRTGPSNTEHVPQHVHVDETLAYTLETGGYPIRLGVDIINMFNAHYAYRIANGFVGSSYAAPRSVFLTLSLPLAAEPHHAGEK